MRSIKIKVYWEKNFDIPVEIIQWDLDFSEDINAGQWWLDITLNIPYDDTTYSVGNMLEYSIYNDNYKSWLLKYAWIIKNIRRIYKWNEQSVILECESITDLLVSVEINKTYSWTYQSIVSDIISDMWDNTCNMDFIWSIFFKNHIQDTSISPDVEIDGNLLQALQKLFENKKFFINQYGEIKDTFSKKHILRFGSDIIENEIQEWENGVENVDMVVRGKLDVSVWDKIKVVNTDSFINLDNLQISKLDFSVDQQNIFIWDIKQIKTS